MIESKGRGVLDAPLEPVIGLAEGETRWRSMTALRVAASSPLDARPDCRARTLSVFPHICMPNIAALWLDVVPLA